MAKMTKVLVSMPPDLVQSLDREAKLRGVSRSELLRAAARAELGEPERDLSLEERAEAVERILQSGAAIREAIGDRKVDWYALRWGRGHGHSA